MAAAEYFSSAPMSQTAPQPYQQQAQTPTSHPQQQHQPIPQIQTHPAPPNQQQQFDQRPAVHFATPPHGSPPQRHSFSGQQRPNLATQSGGYHPMYNQGHQQQTLQPYGSPHSTGYSSPQQRPQHLAPHMRPYANPNSSQYSLQNGYSSDPEPDRRRRKHKKRRDSDEKKNKSRSTKSDAFLGAAGGGLIGDMIFPGLGTVGGAALGWLGGKDYGKHRKVREDKLAEAQREWEEIHRPEQHRRDRSRERGSRDSSGHAGERYRRHS